MGEWRQTLGFPWDWNCSLALTTPLNYANIHKALFNPFCSPTSSQPNPISGNFRFVQKWLIRILEVVQVVSTQNFIDESESFRTLRCFSALFAISIFPFFFLSPEKSLKNKRRSWPWMKWKRLATQRFSQISESLQSRFFLKNLSGFFFIAISKFLPLEFFRKTPLCEVTLERVVKIKNQHRIRTPFVKVADDNFRTRCMQNSDLKSCTNRFLVFLRIFLSFFEKFTQKFQSTKSNFKLICGTSPLNKPDILRLWVCLSNYQIRSRILPSSPACTYEHVKGVSERIALFNCFCFAVHENLKPTGVHHTRERWVVSPKKVSEFWYLLWPTGSCACFMRKGGGHIFGKCAWLEWNRIGNRWLRQMDWRRLAETVKRWESERGTQWVNECVCVCLGASVREWESWGGDRGESESVCESERVRGAEERVSVQLRVTVCVKVIEWDIEEGGRVRVGESESAWERERVVWEREREREWERERDRESEREKRTHHRLW